MGGIKNDFCARLCLLEFLLYGVEFMGRLIRTELFSVNQNTVPQQKISSYFQFFFYFLLSRILITLYVK